MGDDDRQRLTIDFAGLADRINAAKTTVEWRELPFSKKVKVLLEERLVLGEDIRATARDLKQLAESGQIEDVITRLQSIIDALTI